MGGSTRWGLQAADGGGYPPDLTEHDLEDLDLGAAAMDDNTEPGGGQAGGEAGGSGHGVGFDDWPDDEEDNEPCHAPSTDQTCASSSTAPTGAPGASKRAAEGMFGSKPTKKTKSTATKTAAIRKAPKERPMVSRKVC